MLLFADCWIPDFADLILSHLVLVVEEGVGDAGRGQVFLTLIAFIGHVQKTLELLT